MYISIKFLRIRERMERELLSFMGRSACLFLHKHNIIVRWENITNVIDQFHAELATALYYIRKTILKEA